MKPAATELVVKEETETRENKGVPSVLSRATSVQPALKGHRRPDEPLG
jgi:hypothetical protein